MSHIIGRWTLIAVLAFVALLGVSTLDTRPAAATEEPVGSTVELELVVDCDSYSVLADIDLFVDGGNYSLVVDGVSSPIDEDVEDLEVASGSLPADLTVDVALYFGNEKEPRASDSVTVDAKPCPVSITVEKDANGAGSLEFDFDGTLGNFHLGNDETKTVNGLAAGSYLIREISTPGWTLTKIDCGDADVSDADVSDGDIRVQASAGDDILCTFTNTKDPAATSTPAPTATPAPTSTPITVFIPVPGPTQIVERVVTITPPSTGDGGLR